eukprot:TRINITY_DN5912_c0_g4_i1.p1 TRINITY_DN5912_c0_g4~~TRINITY_DN5912_c0_g4_i1.p1  ORF type:complete len:280 (+),score=87.47 TRINITY_DN5912_c0_g4_i1:79-918(+)
MMSPVDDGDAEESDDGDVSVVEHVNPSSSSLISSGSVAGTSRVSAVHHQAPSPAVASFLSQLATATNAANSTLMQTQQLAQQLQGLNLPPECSGAASQALATLQQLNHISGAVAQQMQAVASASQAQTGQVPNGQRGQACQPALQDACRGSGAASSSSSGTLQLQQSMPQQSAALTQSPLQDAMDSLTGAGQQGKSMPMVNPECLHMTCGAFTVVAALAGAFFLGSRASASQVPQPTPAGAAASATATNAAAAAAQEHNLEEAEDDDEDDEEEDDEEED